VFESEEGGKGIRGQIEIVEREKCLREPGVSKQRKGGEKVHA